MSQMISSGSRAATSTTKSHPPLSATRLMTSLAWNSMRSSIDLIMRGLNAVDTMRRSRAWRGLSMLIMEPKKSSISSGMSIIEVAPAPDWKISGCRLASEMSAWRVNA